MNNDFKRKKRAKNRRVLLSMFIAFVIFSLISLGWKTTLLLVACIPFITAVLILVSFVFLVGFVIIFETTVSFKNWISGE